MKLNKICLFIKSPILTKSPQNIIVLNNHYHMYSAFANAKLLSGSPNGSFVFNYVLAEPGGPVVNYVVGHVNTPSFKMC